MNTGSAPCQGQRPEPPEPEPALNDCPFCGSKGYLIETENHLREDFIPKYFVECSGRQCSFFGPESKIKQGAADLWNFVSAAPEMFEALKDTVSTLTALLHGEIDMRRNRGVVGVLELLGKCEHALEKAANPPPEEKGKAPSTMTVMCLCCHRISRGKALYLSSEDDKG